MKKVLKVCVRFFSLAAFAILVSVGGLFGRFSRNDQDAKVTTKLPDGVFAGFNPNVAHADAAPSSDGGVGGDGGSSDSGSDSGSDGGPSDCGSDGGPSDC